MSKLTVSTTINASLETVWNAMWNPEHIIHWAFADAATWHCPWAKGEEPKVWDIFTTRMEARDGSFGFDLTAKYTEVTRMKSMSYTLGEMKEYFLDAGRVVDVTFEEVPLPLDKGGQGGFSTRVTEVFDAEDIHPAEMQIAGWSAILENFKKHVESL